ncbi:MAG: RNA polymerase sigma factor [Ruminiclostridium sp.]|nr:RNA polymerase sigma factor [Ruminiclostridium sp.]
MQQHYEQLIPLAKQGNQKAITELYEMTYSSIYHTVKAIIRDEDTVLDILQDSYIKGFQSLDTLDSPSAYRAWMKRIAINKAKDHLKKKSPILFSEMASQEGDELPFQDDRPDHLPEEVLDQQETTRLIREILDTLNEEQRLVIGLFYYEDMSVKEIAALLGCSENTVKSRLRYGRKHIEHKVKELEQQGTKLYSLAPLPFLLWLFRMDTQTQVVPSSLVLQKISASAFAPAPKAANFAPAKAPVPQSTSTTVAAGAAKSAAKPLVAKVLASILAVAVVGGGAVALLNTTKTDVVPTDSSPVVTEEITLEDQLAQAEVAYQSVLEDYETVCAMDSAVFLAEPEQYFNGDHMAVRYYHMYHSHCFYSANHDLDGNGIPELLIGINTQDRYAIVDVYSYEQDGLIPLFDEPTLGDRSQVYLLSDGTLYFIGNSSAWDTTHTYLKLNGTGLEIVPNSSAPEISPSWEYLCGQEAAPEPATQSVPSFDSILAEIQALCSIPLAEYEADPSYYDAQYRHLGTGIPWLLQSGRQSGAYTMCVWTTTMDVDSDSTAELCIGLGVSPSRVNPIAVYDSTPSGITVTEGDALYPLLDSFGGSLPVDWTYCCG